SREEELLIIAKVLQGKNWQEVADELGWTQYKVMTRLKDIMRRMGAHFFNLSEESRVGLELDELEDEFPASKE
ncbi:MAG: hypothetical protein GSR78_00270, partial [Desulfurococcales archaeon]|nr:hypothetical protein [Desulfurococcales archaeon]